MYSLNLIISSKLLRLRSITEQKSKRRFSGSLVLGKLTSKYFCMNENGINTSLSASAYKQSMSSFLFDYTHIHRNWHSNWSIIEFFTVPSSSSSRLLNAMMMAVVVVVHISYSGSVSFVCGFVVHLLTFSRLASNNCWTQ